MESRRQRPAGTHSLRKKTKAESSALAWSLPNIAELIEDGEITIGRLRPIGCVATAADQDITYAMLVRRRGETLSQLLARLDKLWTRPSRWASSPTRSTPKNREFLRCRHPHPSGRSARKGGRGECRDFR